MPQIASRQPGTRRRLGNIAPIIIALAAIAIVYWGTTHRPIRRREGPMPPTVPVVATPEAEAAVPQPGSEPVRPTPTLAPNDVMIYTLNGREVCSGYPVGELGYNLRCGVPAGVYLFRVIDATGESALAVRYNDQVVVRVGP